MLACTFKKNLRATHKRKKVYYMYITRTAIHSGVVLRALHYVITCNPDLRNLWQAVLI
jgi:hypothetical protein